MIDTFYSHLQDDIRWEGYRHLLAQKGITTINENNEHYDALFLLKILSIQEVQGLSLRQLGQSLHYYLSLSRLLRLPPKPLPEDNDKEKKNRDKKSNQAPADQLPTEEILLAFRGQLAQQHSVEPLIQHLYAQLQAQGFDSMPRSDKNADDETTNDTDDPEQSKPPNDDRNPQNDHNCDHYNDYGTYGEDEDYYEDAFSFMPPPDPDTQQKLCPECGSANIRQRPQNFLLRLFGRNSDYICLCCANKFD